VNRPAGRDGPPAPAAGPRGPAVPPGAAALREPGAVPDPAALPPSGARLLNIANAVTLLRFLLVPVFVVLLASGGDRAFGWRIGAAVVFVLAVLTDRVDGDLARRRGLVTEFGKIADPLADKALIGAALCELSVLGALPWVITAVILVREVAITVLRFVVIHRGVIPASRGGKVKTTLQAVAIVLYVLPLGAGADTGRLALMAAAVLITVATGADYLVRAAALRRVAARGGPPGQVRPTVGSLVAPATTVAAAEPAERPASANP
jgi:CDP-diacylglycerol--glycerol-3-phosphate 3-phosphatidyltransferase